jgi:hypothetical protein
MQIKICAPSYKRPDKVDVLKYLPSVKIYVDEKESENYKKYNPNANIVAVESKFQGNLCRIRNKILDDHKGDVVCIIDDDLKVVGYHERIRRVSLNTEREFMEFLHKYTVLALDLGVKLWGINVTNDKQCYREYTPFSMSSYIGGPFMVHIDTDLRFDERLPLKEDYDFTLQNLNKYRKVLRVNKFFYVVKQMEQVGGCATYRNLEREIEQLNLLRKKWGSRIVQNDSLDNSRSHQSDKKRTFDVNPIIRVPIGGI